MAFVFEFVYIVDYVDGFPYIKPSLNPWNEMIVYISDPKISTRELLNLINSFSEVAGYKICLKQVNGLSLHKE